MEPVFTMQYGEFAVVDYLSKNIKDVSVFVPASAQEKGIDLLLYRYSNGQNTTCTIQVKMSRTYYIDNPRNRFKYYLWFNRFNIHENADWYILIGVIAKFPEKANTRLRSISWESIMLAFTQEEMRKFMNSVKQKKDITKDDKMFGFGFNDDKDIFQTRGCKEHRNMSNYLIGNRLNDILNSFIK